MPIFTLDDAIDTIQSELNEYPDGQYELDAWENASERLWYACVREHQGNDSAQHCKPGQLGQGPTLRAALMDLARRFTYA